ncbi:hypothetical protein [Enterobacter cloacae complex sp. 339J8]|uniref:hypothetical protein n=1 Tax=Enterobacter cloacae complex sp. 339J8 TaxID=3395869 RepID=UPI003CF8B882
MVLFIGVAIAYTNSKRFDIVGIVIVGLVYIALNYTRTGLGVDEPVYLEAYKDYIQLGILHFEYSFNAVYYLLSLADVEPLYFNRILSTLFILISIVVILKCVAKPYQTLGLVFFYFFLSLLILFSMLIGKVLLFYSWHYLCIIFQTIGKKNQHLCFSLGLVFIGHPLSLLLSFSAARFISLRLARRLNVVVLLLTSVAAVVPLKIIPFVSAVLLAGSFGSPYALKVIHYLDSPIAYFYDLNMLGRLPLMIAVITTLIYVFIYRNIIPVLFYKVIIILMLYCLLFLEMSYSFRNYYWVLPFLPLLMANMPCFVKNNNNERKSALVIALLFHLILSITGYYTSGIMPMIFQ